MPGDFLVLKLTQLCWPKVWKILQQHPTAKLYLDHDKAAAKEVAFIKQAHSECRGMPATFIMATKTLMPISKFSSRAGGWAYEKRSA